MCGISGASAFTATGNPIAPSRPRRPPAASSCRLLRTLDAVELQQPAALRLVQRTRAPFSMRIAFAAVRVRPEVGDGARLRLLQLDQRADRTGRGAVPLQERQPRAFARTAWRKARRRAGSSRPRRRPPSSPSAARARRRAPARPTRASFSPRGGNASNATNPTAGSSASASSAPTNMSVSTAAWPVTSSGLFCDAKWGSAFLSRALRLRRELGQRQPRAPAASANSVHAPPDWSAAATPVVRSFLRAASSTAASNIVDRVLDEHGAVAAKPGIAKRGVPGERAGVRDDRAARRLAAALGRADEHRLSRRAQRVEPPADALDVAHRLDVGRDDLRVRDPRPPTRTCRRARSPPRCRRRG